MSLQVNGALLTDVGRQRSVNEDWCGSFTPDDDQPAVGAVSVWVIADGVSRFGTGREAARFAVEAVLAAGWDQPDQDIERQIREAVTTANRILWNRAHEAGPRPRPHAATIVVAVVQDDTVWIASAGDCRAYLIRDRAIRQITQDHTVAAEEVRRGRLRPEDLARHPGRNTITRCLGQRASVQPDLFRERLQPGDRVVLCSDGISRHVADDQIVQVVTSTDPRSGVSQLVERANRGGGSDNITVGILDVVAARQTPARPVTPAHPVTPARPITPAQFEPTRPVTPAPVVRPAPHTPPPISRSVPIPPPSELDATPRPDTPPRPQSRPRFTDVSAARLAALQAMSQRINGSLEVSATLSAVLDSLIDITGAERACIMLREDRTGRLEFSVGRNLDARAVEGDPTISRNIAAKVYQDQQPLLIGNAAADPRFRSFESVVVQSLRSVMCAPLIVRGGCIGVVYVDNSLSAELFTQADMDLVTAFATMAAAAIENARLHEQLAAQVSAISAMKTAQDRVLRSVSSGIIAVDRAGKIETINQAAAEMLLVAADDVVGKSLGEILPPRFMLALGAPFGGDGSEPGATIQGFEMAGDLRGRGYVHFQHRLSPLRDENGTNIGYVLVLEDHTERERLERDRRTASAERQRIERIFRIYMAPAVFQEVLRQGAEHTGIAGDRRELTILFADIRGFTGLSERLEPEQVVGVLNGYLSAATDVIFEHQGTIDKFMGDAIMALFGAPVPMENHALQAVKTALAMQRRFAEMPPQLGQRATFGVGINTGQGIVGSIGASQLMSYTVIGDVVNVAARLQGEARAGEVLITADTYSVIADHVEAEELGSIYVKGRLSPVTMYKVTALRDRR